MPSPNPCATNLLQTPLQQLQFLDKYSRWHPQLGRRESWEETVDRATTWLQQKVPIGPWDDVRAAMLAGGVMTSMRVLQMAGPALDRCEVGSFNCAYLPLDSLESFSELLYILMQGTGCGFSVEARYVRCLPKVAQYQSGNHLGTYPIPDSTVGWCDALLAGLRAWVAGHIVDFDYTAIRPSGARLVTKGGRASGPGPLRELLEFARSKVEARRGLALRPIDVHDIACFVGWIVQVGGVRRAATISLSDLGDTELRDAKKGDWYVKHPWRAMSNNSAVWTQAHLDASGLPATDLWNDEWSALVASGSGERGMFNRQAKIPERRQVVEGMGVNPCLSGDTRIATLDGPKSFRELAEAGQDVQVHAWHQETKVPVVRWMRNPRCTGRNVPVLEVEFDSGLKVKCTYDHSFYSFRGNKVKARDLKVGKSIRAWSMSVHRDGYFRVHGWTHNQANHQWLARMVYENAYGPIAAGYVVHHKNENKQDNKISNLELLTSYAHQSQHYPARLAAGFYHKTPPKNHKVLAVREAGTADVYNGTVDDAHTYIVLDPEAICGVASGIVSANCGEILLRPSEFCNLSIVVARPSDSLAQLADKVRLASFVGTVQSTLTSYGYLSERWKHNSEEERLLGVDITGQQDCPALRAGAPDLANNLQFLREVAVAENIKWANQLGINPSAAVTCVKPSGNSSVLLDASSGIHPRYAPFYVRRVRLGAGGPLHRLVRDSGVACYPEVGHNPEAPLVMVAEFPVQAPPGAITRADMSALQQFENWLVVKKNWTEHSASATIQVKDNEWAALGAAVRASFSDVAGLTFLPFDSGTYRLAPYQAIDEQEYQARVAAMPAIDFSRLADYETEDGTTSSREYSCVSGQCDI